MFLRLLNIGNTKLNAQENDTITSTSLNQNGK